MHTTDSTTAEKRAAKTSLRSRRTSAWRKGIIAAVVAVAVVVLFTQFDVRALLRETLDWTQGIGPWGQVLLVLIYIAATVLLIPGSALGLGAGAVFGVVRGSLLVSVGSTLGATCAFLLGRYLARGWVARKIDAHGSFTAIDRAVGGEGWKIVFRTDKIVGATIVAAHAGDLISEITLAMTHRLGLKEIAGTIHPYPTQADAIRKAGDIYNRTRLTPLVKSVMNRWLWWQRR